MSLRKAVSIRGRSTFTATSSPVSATRGAVHLCNRRGGHRIGKAWKRRIDGLADFPGQSRALASSVGRGASYPAVRATAGPARCPTTSGRVDEDLPELDVGRPQRRQRPGGGGMADRPIADPLHRPDQLGAPEPESAVGIKGIHDHAHRTVRSSVAPVRMSRIRLWAPRTRLGPPAPDDGEGHHSFHPECRQAIPMTGCDIFASPKPRCDHAQKVS